MLTEEQIKKIILAALKQPGMYVSGESDKERAISLESFVYGLNLARGTGEKFVSYASRKTENGARNVPERGLFYWLTADELLEFETSILAGKTEE